MCDGGTVEVEDLDEPLPVEGLADMQAECRCVFGVVQLPLAPGPVERAGREVVAVAR